MSEEITWTKEYKLERYHKLNLTAEKGCVLLQAHRLWKCFRWKNSLMRTVSQ